MWKKDDSSAECGVVNAEFTLSPALPPRGGGLGWGGHAEQQRAFTLLEVMVAVAILATVLVTLLGLKNRGLQDVMLAEHMTTATLLAKRMMTEALVIGPAVPMEDEGTFDEEEFKDYTWKKSVTVIPVTETETIKEIRVAVLWKEGEREETVELVSYE